MTGNLPLGTPPAFPGWWKTRKAWRDVRCRAGAKGEAPRQRRELAELAAPGAHGYVAGSPVARARPMWWGISGRAVRAMLSNRSRKGIGVRRRSLVLWLL